jgi:hypothetical protein
MEKGERERRKGKGKMVSRKRGGKGEKWNNSLLVHSFLMLLICLKLLIYNIFAALKCWLIFPYERCHQSYTQSGAINC